MISKLNYCWRVLGTGFCFALFGLGGMILSLTILPLQRLIYRQTEVRQRKARKLVHYTFRFFVAVMDTLGVIGFHVHNRDAFKNLRGQLILANHPSLIDVVVLIASVPRADCVVKAHLFKNPFMRGVIQSTGYISNDDPEGLLVDCCRSLAAGNNLIIFPEGTRSDKGSLQKFKRGAANIALRCGLPSASVITSVLITMKPSTLTKGTPWYKVAPKKAHFSMHIAAEQPQPWQGHEHEPMSMQSRGLTKHLETYFHNQVANL
ncbi:lysophospholipid acyltransferase family protein [Pseudoalteromonas sp. YIC-827]|uniref:Lysophospholipid acyltransferase family protein n=1 Tax=Pseudoalteromonas qingdaonensis TaxID=3131913 RepID=A0ABU9MY18_9GAMM